ncbi:MAG: CoA transferase [Chloroflexi bacterium]|nr:CoA transferase [Chloroflexota bacterium]
MAKGPLSGIRVLDMGAFGVGPVSCGLLGQLGADVIRVEPPSGDGLMFVATMIGGMGACYVGAHFNKKNIVLDLHNEADKEKARSLITWADIVVENRRVGTMQKMGFDYEAVRKLNPGLIYISSPAYGTSGPFMNYAGADHYIQSATGFVQLSGKEGGGPEIYRYVAYIDMANSSVIAQAAVLALLDRQRTGSGRYLATSSFNGGIAMQTTRLAEFFATGRAPARLGTANPNFAPSQAFRTLDNSYVLVSAPSDEHWKRLCRALEIENLRDDPRFNTNQKRVENRAELIALLEEKFRDKPRRWWLIHLQKSGVPCGYVAYFDDVVRDPHIAGTGLVVDKQSPWGRVTMVNAPFQFSRTPTEPLEASHAPDADREAVLSLLDKGPWRSVAFNQKPAALPLENVRVIDLSEDIAGSFCAMTLADAGAEVIKVETPAGNALRAIGPEADGQSALFAALNRNKKSIILDLATEKGEATLYRLIQDADVVIDGDENKAAEIVGAERLARLKKLVRCTVTPFGEEGPYAGRPASELELQGISGLLQYLGEPGEAPVRLGADVVSLAAGIHAATGVLAALYESRQSGLGQKVSVSLLGAALWMGSSWIWNQSNPDAYASYFQTGPYDHAEGGYRTKDKPIMFGLFTSTAERAAQTWQQFCRRLGMEGLLADPYFAEHGPRTLGMGREAQEMKPLFESAFERHTAAELVEMIQGIGGMGAAFMTYEELYGDPPHPQVAVNRMLVELKRPAGMRGVSLPYKISGMDFTVRCPPPLPGEHTEEILRASGHSEVEIARLKKSKVAR